MKKVSTQTRRISTSAQLATALVTLRRGQKVGHDPILKLQEIEKLERRFESCIPDAVLATIAAGARVLGDRPPSLTAMEELTLIARENFEDESEQQGESFVVFDEDDNGNYLAFSTNAGKDTDWVYFVDHEGPTLIWSSLLSVLDRIIEASGYVREPNDRLVVRVDVTRPTMQRVSHPKFGEGEVLRQTPDSMTVKFDNHGEKTLVSSFLTLIPQK